MFQSALERVLTPRGARAWQQRLNNLSYDHFAYGSTMMARWMSQRRAARRSALEQGGPLCLFGVLVILLVTARMDLFQQHPMSLLFGTLLGLAGLVSHAGFSEYTLPQLCWISPAFVLLPMMMLLFVDSSASDTRLEVAISAFITSEVVFIALLLGLKLYMYRRAVQREQEKLEQLSPTSSKVTGRRRTSSFGHHIPVGASSELRQSSWEYAIVEEDWDPQEH